MPKQLHVTNHSKFHPEWKWEIIASIGGFAALFGMVILLAVYDGKEVSTWHGVTLNAVVSALSTTSKALFLFAISQSIGQWKWVAFSKGSRPLLDLERIDTASRGPFGSVQWLWLSNIKQRSLIQLGAFITLVAIAVDPFSQQLVQYEQKLRSVADNSTTVVRAQRFSRGVTLVPTVLPITVTSMADYSIQASILNALIQPYDAIIQQTAFTCPSGNCTWNPFQSLAICHTCNDLRDQLSFHSEPSYLYNDLHKRIAYSYLTKNATSAQLPNGLYINNVNGASYNMPEDYHPPINRDTSEFIYMTSFGTGNTSRTASFGNSDNLLWAMGFLKVHAPETDSSSSQGWPNMSVDALECGLFYCVNEYSAAVRNGILDERETPVLNARRSADSWSLIDYTYPNLQNIKIDNQSLNSLEFNSSLSALGRTDLMLGNGFNLSWAAITSLSSQFQTQFTAPKSLNMSKHGISANAMDCTPINGFYKNLIMSHDSADEFSPSIMQKLYNTSDLNDIFRRLARGMSNAIRAGADDAEVWTGTSAVMTTYYHIWWPWITLHAVVALGGISFLLCTIIGSTSSNIPIWKSSTLALLSLAVSDAIGNTLAGVDSLEDMEVKASQHFVQLFDARRESESDAGEAHRSEGEARGSLMTLQRSEDGYVSEESGSLRASP